MVSALVSGAIVVVLVVVYIAHALLRMFLQDRGVTPWTLRDTVGATPLLVIGAAVAWVSGAMTIARLVSGHTALRILGDTSWIPSSTVAYYAFAILLAGVGLGMMWLGIRSLRKLL